MKIKQLEEETGRNLSQETVGTGIERRKVQTKKGETDKKRTTTPLRFVCALYVLAGLNAHGQETRTRIKNFLASSSTASSSGLSDVSTDSPGTHHMTQHVTHSPHARMPDSRHPGVAGVPPDIVDNRARGMFSPFLSESCKEKP